ncbi:hypothetical protein BJ912DRAFT_111339 [Pholiota molesta]|nr:hypothetical protein BJ912DRAFT_111339 [Pholiota molesta]
MFEKFHGLVLPRSMLCIMSCIWMQCYGRSLAFLVFWTNAVKAFPCLASHYIRRGPGTRQVLDDDYAYPPTPQPAMWRASFLPSPILWSPPLFLAKSRFVPRMYPFI